MLPDDLFQCFPVLTNIWLIYEITLKIGCRRLYTQMVAFLFYMAPIVFGEVLTTQVDQFSVVWLLIFVYYYVEMSDEEYHFRFNGEAIGKYLIMGSCIAFGYMAKTSVLLAIATFVLMLLILCIKRKDSVCIIGKLLLCTILVIMIILAPEFIRNIQSFGSVLLPIAGQRQLIGTLNSFYIFVNGLKNFTFNVPPNIYLDQSGHWAAAVVY